MKGAQRSIITLLNLSLIAAMLSSSFLATQGFFNDLISSKQYCLEIVCLFTGVLFIVVLLSQKLIQFTKTDFLVLLSAAWYLVNELISDGKYTPINQIFFNLLLWGMIYMIIRQASGNTLFVWGIANVWMIVVLMQSGLGLMQLYGLERSYHGLFNITGTFHNPGPFSGFVVSGLPIALSVISYQSTVSSQQLSEKKLGVRSLELGLKYSIQILGWLTLVLILLVLPPAQSRAAWMAGLVGVAFLLIRFPNKISVRDSLVSRFKNLKRSMRLLITISVLAVVVGSATGFYLFKQGSADGRLLIWRITTQMIKTKPITGYGAGAFNALYMDEQARWFASGKGSETQALVAGSPEAPFNEFLKLWLEKGLIGLLLVGALLFYLIKKQHPKENSLTAQDESINTHSLNQGLIVALQGALISLLVFSLFSYPFDLSPFVLISITLLAVLAPFSKSLLNISSPHLRWSALPIILILAAFSIQAYPLRKEHYQALSVWQDADRFYSLENYEIAIEAYQEAYPTFEHNGLFLQMYGKVLSMDKQFHKSNKILAEAEQYKSSQIIQNTLGDNHKALGNYAQAEEAYIKSAQMIPSTVFPKYLLAKLYSENGQHKKAKQIAETILNSEVKVESSATREIMNEMKKISEQLSVSSMTDN